MILYTATVPQICVIAISIMAENAVQLRIMSATAKPSAVGTNMLTYVETWSMGVTVEWYGKINIVKIINGNYYRYTILYNKMRRSPYWNLDHLVTRLHLRIQRIQTLWLLLLKQNLLHSDYLEQNN